MAGVANSRLGASIDGKLQHSHEFLTLARAAQHAASEDAIAHACTCAHAKERAWEDRVLEKMSKVESVFSL